MGSLCAGSRSKLLDVSTTCLGVVVELAFSQDNRLIIYLYTYLSVNSEEGHALQQKLGYDDLENEATVEKTWGNLENHSSVGEMVRVANVCLCAVLSMTDQLTSFTSVFLFSIHSRPEGRPSLSEAYLPPPKSCCLVGRLRRSLKPI